MENLMRTEGTWIEYLNEDEQEFIKNLILFSGSLKQLGTYYKISYPTLRLKLDRLIEKIKVVTDNQLKNPFEKTLKLKLEEGKIDNKTYKDLLKAYKK
jgi:hypothetical protein